MGKAYADYTIRDISRLEGAFLSKEPEQLASFKYLEGLLMTTNFPEMREMKLLALFPHETKTNRMVEEKVKINEIFIAQYQLITATRATQGHGLSVLEASKDSVVKATQISFDTRIVRATNSKDSCLSSFETYSREAQDYLTQTIKYKREVEELERLKALGSADTRDYDAITAILKNSFWCFVEYDEGSKMATFCTTQPVVQRHINVAAGINTEVDLGYLAVEMKIGDLSCKVVPFYGSLYNISNHVHPNINCSGSICWGTANHERDQKVLDRDYAGIMDLLCGLLMNYSDGTPYHDLEVFKRQLADASKPFVYDTARFYSKQEAKDRCNSDLYEKVKDTLTIPMITYEPLQTVPDEAVPTREMTAMGDLGDYAGYILVDVRGDGLLELGYVRPSFQSIFDDDVYWRSALFTVNKGSAPHGMCWKLETSELVALVTNMRADFDNADIEVRNFEYPRYILKFEERNTTGIYHLGQEVLDRHGHTHIITGIRETDTYQCVSETRSGNSYACFDIIPKFEETGAELIAKIDEYKAMLRTRSYSPKALTIEGAYPQYLRLVEDEKMLVLAKEVEDNKAKFEDKLTCSECSVTNGDTVPEVTIHEESGRHIIQGNMECWNCGHKYVISEQMREILDATD